MRPKTGKVQRGYIPRIMASGKREISDPFPAGATGDMTYSQFMPIKKDGKVVSICFVTTPLSLLSERVTRRDHTGNGYYLMLSSTGSLIAHPNPTMSLTHIRDLGRGRTVPLRQQPGNLPPRHQKRSAGDVHQHF